MTFPNPAATTTSQKVAGALLGFFEALAGLEVGWALFSASTNPLSPQQIVLGALALAVLLAALLAQKFAPRLHWLWASVLMLVVIGVAGIAIVQNQIAAFTVQPVDRTAVENAPDLYLPAPRDGLVDRAVKAVQGCDKIASTSNVWSELQRSGTVIVDGRCDYGSEQTPVGAYAHTSFKGTAASLLFTGTVLKVECRVPDGTSIRPSKGPASTTWLRFDDGGVKLYFSAVWAQGPLPSKICTNPPGP